MPTADPFDPIDGREGDVQMLYPMERVCADRIDIHRSLLRLAEGVVDQRWLLWLTRRTDGPSRRLANELAASLPATWAAARSLSDRDLQAFRERILDHAAGITR
jgi:hypothetical protein